MPIINLASESPYAAALSADFIPERCLRCFLQLEKNEKQKSLEGKEASFKRCQQCGAVRYCGEECLREDAHDHQPECKAYRNWNVAGRGQVVEQDYNAAYGDEKLRLLARLIRRQGRDRGKVDLTTGRPESVKVRHLSDLMSHLDRIQRDPIRGAHLPDYVSDLYGFFANTTEDMSPHFTTVDEIEQLVGRMSINCFGVSSTTVDDETHIGVAIYLTSSRFDHSCKPNLWMEFEGNRLTWRYHCQDANQEPDYDKLWVSYGYMPSYAGYTALATRHQRRLSLDARYYFLCQCELCSDEGDAELSEGATTRLCKACRQPYVFKPEAPGNKTIGKGGFSLLPSCQCSDPSGGEKGFFNDCFEDAQASPDLDLLLKEWCTTFHPAERFHSATGAVSKLEPLRRLAHRYWHPKLNLRYVQINETLFHAYRAIALASGVANHADEGSPTPPTVTIFPIPECSGLIRSMRDRALVAGCLCGEMVVEAYQGRMEPYETVMARFCFQLGQMYEMLRRNATNGAALKNYQRALDVWRMHGDRGKEQCEIIETRMRRVAEEVVESASSGSAAAGAMVEEVKILRISADDDEAKRTKEEKCQVASETPADAPATNCAGGEKGKVHRSKKKRKKR